MSRTAMRQLRSVNPVPELPTARPIETVITGWQALDRGRGSVAQDVNRGRGGRAGSLAHLFASLGAAGGFALAIAVAVIALGAGHAVNRAGSRMIVGGGGPPRGAIVPLRRAGPLVVGSDGALYVADVQTHQVLVRLAGGRFRVIAGTGTQGFSGDGGLATQADLSTITDLAVARSGSVYIADGGRIRVVGTNGVIHTVAGDGQAAKDIMTATPALSAPLGSRLSLAAGTSWLNIAFSRSGELYLSTGSQILHLTTRGTVVPVRAVATTGPGALRGELRRFGPIAVDGHGNIDVSGVNGWAIWQAAPNGEATEVGNPASARRSGGGYSVLERGPDGYVYGEDGPTLLRIVGRKLVPAFAFTARVDREYFELTYFAFSPTGTLYADELPGGIGFEARQQLVSVRSGHEMLLWEQPSRPTP